MLSVKAACIPVAHRHAQTALVTHDPEQTSLEPRKHQAVNVAERQSLLGFAPQPVELVSKDRPDRASSIVAPNRNH
jgi:hypothetical protein